MGSGRLAEGAEAEVRGRDTGPDTGRPAVGAGAGSAPLEGGLPDSPPRVRIAVRVLGRPAIIGAPADLHIRPQAVEFLVYLVVLDGEVYQQEIIADLMPEPARRKAVQRLHTYTYNLRQIFTHIGGDNTYLRLKRQRYSLNPEMFDIDLWTMRTAAAEAAAAIDPGTRITALRHAVLAYTGPLATGTDYPWITAYRDTVRREYIAAVTALADTLADRPDEARAALAVAVRHHPDDEDLAASLRRLSASA